jgi:hypothetical protein
MHQGMQNASEERGTVKINTSLLDAFLQSPSVCTEPTHVSVYRCPSVHPWSSTTVVEAPLARSQVPAISCRGRPSVPSEASRLLDAIFIKIGSKLLARGCRSPVRSRRRAAWGRMGSCRVDGLGSSMRALAMTVWSSDSWRRQGGCKYKCFLLLEMATVAL